MLGALGCGRASEPSAPPARVAPIADLPVPTPPADAPEEPAEPEDFGWERLTRVARMRNVEILTASDERTSFESSGCRKIVGFDDAGAALFDNCHTCTLAKPGEVYDDVMTTLGNSLRLTPDSMVAAAGLRQVALCRVLRAKYGSDEPGGGVDPGAGITLIKVEGRRGFSDTETVLHHELFHLFDHKTRQVATQNDPEWVALNPPSFQYSTGDVPLVPGFVRPYSLRNAGEDKATTYEYMMARGKALCTMVAADPILLAKARLIRARVEAAIGRDVAAIDTWSPCLASAQ